MVYKQLLDLVAAKTFPGKLKQSLDFLILTKLFSFTEYHMGDVYFEAYGCEQNTWVKNYYFASSPHTLNEVIVFGFLLTPR